MSEDLEKQAQEKLSQAWNLINEAGELAKQGQFSLHFGEVGDFIPRSAVDGTILREKAIENLKRDGRPNGSERVADPENPGRFIYVDNPHTPWDELDEDEQEEAIEAEIEGLQDEMDVPYEFKEYCGVEDADQWWYPSRC